MRYAIMLLFLLAACTEPAVKREAAEPDDGCVGYMIKPDGSRTCVGK
jgi:hypothetical protein